MSFYFVIFLILAFFSFLEIFSKKSSSTLPFFFVFSLVLFFLSFIRWETGTDWFTYENYFNSVNDWFIESEFELGFSLLNEFVKIYFDSYTFLLFLLGLVVFVLQTKSIYDYSFYPITSLFVLWSMSFSNIYFVRQTVATLLLFYSIRFIQRNKFYHFIFFVFLAMLFHRTSLVFLFAWWVYRIRISNLKMITLIFLSIIFSFIVGYIIEQLGTLLGGIFQQKVDVYFADSSDTYGIGVSKETLVLRAILNKGLLFGLSILFLNKIESKYYQYRGFVNLYWFGILIYFSTISFSIVLARLAVVYDLTIIIIIVFVFKYLKNIYYKLLLFSFLLFYYGVKLYASIYLYFDFLVPYKSIFDNSI